MMQWFSGKDVVQLGKRTHYCQICGKNSPFEVILTHMVAPQLSVVSIKCPDLRSKLNAHRKMSYICDTLKTQC